MHKNYLARVNKENMILEVITEFTKMNKSNNAL